MNMHHCVSVSASPYYCIFNRGLLLFECILRSRHMALWYYWITNKFAAKMSTVGHKDLVHLNENIIIYSPSIVTFFGLQNYLKINC